MRAVLRTLHRYLGLLLVLPLLVQGITGAILTFEPLLHGPDMPAATGASNVAAPVSIDAIVTAARAVAPEDMHATRYVPPRSAGPAEVWFSPIAGTGPRGVVVVSVDSATRTPLGPPEPRSGPLDWLRRLHTNFLLQDFGGRSIVGWVGVGLLLLSVMGIPIWWPASGQWRAAFTFSLAARGVPFHRRLHGAVGIWVVTFLLASSATGTVLGFPQTVRASLGIQQQTGRGGPAGEMSSGNQAAADSSGPEHKLDTALSLAVTSAPGTAPRMLLLPASTGAPIRVFLAPPGTEGVARMTAVTVDGKATRILNIQDPATMSGAELSLRWTHDIHFGLGLGIVWRVLTIATGLALPVFAVTGTAMWLLRNRNRRRAGFARSAAQSNALSAGE